MDKKELWFQIDSSASIVRGLKGIIKFQLWHLVRFFFFKTSLKFMKRYRVLILKMFGAKIGKGCYVSPHATINLPWLLTMGNYSSIDDYCYIIDEVCIGDYVNVGINVSIIGGQHDLKSRHFTDQQLPVVLCNGAFIGACSTILPGVNIGQMSVIEAGSTISRNIPDNTICMTVYKYAKFERLSEEEYNKYRYNV